MVTQRFGKVSFLLKGVFPFVVRYEVEMIDGQLGCIEDTIIESGIDYLKYDMEWAYQAALETAVWMDIGETDSYWMQRA